MGIRVYFYRIKKGKLDEISVDAEKIWEYLGELDLIEDNPNELFIGKNWEGIYYLLYDKKWFDNTILKGTLLGGTILNKSFNYSYGSPLVQYPQEVNKINKHLKSFTKSDLENKFNPKEFSAQEIYPFDDKWEQRLEEIDCLIYFWEELCKFYQKTVNLKDLILVYWT